jgi:Helix-turn-helix domain
MEITRGYKTELDLNDEQITACKKHAGVARFAYNWGLHRRQEVYQTTGRSIWAMDLHRELNALKQTEFPWMYCYRGYQATAEMYTVSKESKDPCFREFLL